MLIELYLTIRELFACPLQLRTINYLSIFLFTNSGVTHLSPLTVSLYLIWSA